MTHLWRAARDGRNQNGGSASVRLETLSQEEFNCVLHCRPTALLHGPQKDVIGCGGKVQLPLRDLVHVLLLSSGSDPPRNATTDWVIDLRTTSTIIPFFRQ